MASYLQHLSALVSGRGKGLLLACVLIIAVGLAATDADTDAPSVQHDDQFTLTRYNIYHEIPRPLGNDTIYVSMKFEGNGTIPLHSADTILYAHIKHHYPFTAYLYCYNISTTTAIDITGGHLCSEISRHYIKVGNVQCDIQKHSSPMLSFGYKARNDLAKAVIVLNDTNCKAQMTSNDANHAASAGGLSMSLFLVMLFHGLVQYIII